MLGNKQCSMFLSLAILFAFLLSACAPAHYPEEQPRVNHSATPAMPTSSGNVKRGKPYQIAGTWYYPMASGMHYDKTGMASWYGEDFHGKQTANGETYDMYEMTAAHTTLPMPSTVLVTNLDNGKQVKVRVNDRGPFVKSRIIDLSYAAAKALGYTEKGTAHVRVQTLETPVFTTPAPTHVPLQRRKPAIHTEQAYVQVGAFGVKKSADHIANRLQRELTANYHVRVVPAMGIYRVRVGPFGNAEEAATALEQVQRHGYNSAMIVHD